MSWREVVKLQDLDLMIEEARAGGARERARRGGLRTGSLAALEAARARLEERIEPRWRHAYERAQRRYGRAVVPVKGRVCQGCFVTLPTSAIAGMEVLSMCEHCGRILFRPAG